MRFEALSVFPGVFSSYLDASIMGRAQQRGILDFEAYDLRDWTTDRHRTVDDAPFGGGQGMLMKPAPIFEAVEDIAARGEVRPYVVFFSPCGTRYDESCAQRLSRKERVLFVCGRYEGMDERLLPSRRRGPLAWRLRAHRRRACDARGHRLRGKASPGCPRR